MKSFCFELTDDLYKQASRPIRKKEDIISLLLNTLKIFMSVLPVEETNCQSNNKLILNVDKMSRLFYSIENKIFTINFPFSVYKVESIDFLKLKYNNIEIDSYISSLLISIFEENETFSIPFDNMKEFVLQHMAENGWNEADPQDVCDIIKKLIVFETGYLRYEYDKLHANARIHPQNHIDFYYESNNEIKVGLDNRIDSKWLVDFSNINTECKFIK